MEGYLGSAYTYVKAAHLIIIIFWVAGLFMLPRFLAYQAEEAPGSEADRKWSDRTTRLRRIILSPSMILAWVLGLMLAANFRFGVTPGYGWIHAKLLLAFLLTGYHGWMVAMSRKMAAGKRPMPGKKLRLWNEVPALFTILMVVLAVVKPW